MKKTLIPNDLRDYLSIISFVGFIGIFLKFVYDSVLISESMDAIFLMIGGVGLMVAGKVFTVKQWMKDGIQRNEVTFLLSIIVGLASIIIGIFLLLDATIPIKFAGFAGVLALFPAIFILIDYISKNS